MTKFPADFGAAIIASIGLFDPSPANAETDCKPNDVFMKKFDKVSEKRSTKKVKVTKEREKTLTSDGWKKGPYKSFEISSRSVTGQRNHRKVFLKATSKGQKPIYVYRRDYSKGSARDFRHSAISFDIDGIEHKFPVRTSSRSNGCYMSSPDRFTGMRQRICSSWAMSSSTLDWDVVKKIGEQDPKVPFPIYFHNLYGERLDCPIYVPPLEFAGFAKVWEKTKTDFDKKQASN